MNVEFINPFLSATIGVLKTMAFTEVTAGKPFLKNDKISRGDVSGVVGITGPPNGSMSLTFSKECIMEIVSNMLGETFQEVTDDIKDAVGELSNMISGTARNDLGNKGYSFKTSIPTVVSGPGHEIRHMCKAPTIAIPFNTKAGPFVVEISFENGTPTKG
ncbi:MAG: chemotaxis protein CheX [Deltaproteobacteria bacterium]|nr:chemotaxis protein CheX [Deltaproteobacteria bacterium]MBI4794388.1 chemotaxis protein CheX [Deltaproteobacteria bacterium]